MLQDRLTILKAVAPLTGSESAWETLVNTWPGHTLEEGKLFWSFLAPSLKKKSWDQQTFEPGSGQQRLYQALEAKFGNALWEDPEVDAVETTYRIYKGLPGIMTTDRQGDTLPTQVAVMAYFMNVTSDAYRTRHREAGTWAPRLAPWLSRPKDDDSLRDHLVHTLLSRQWVDPWAPIQGVPLPLWLRQPKDVAAWVSGGGDLDRPGLDPAHPDHRLWQVLHDRHPGLRDQLIQHSASARHALGDLPSAQEGDALLEKLRRMPKYERATSETWWNLLTEHPQWMQLRASQNDTPVWLALLRQKMALLPYLLKEAEQNPLVRTHLVDTNRHGEGVWSVVMKHSDSRSLNASVLTRLAQWVPTTSPTLWLGFPASKAEWPLSSQTGSDKSWLGRTFAKNASAELRKVLPWSVVLGTPEQQHALLSLGFEKNKKSARDLIKSLNEREWHPYRSAMLPEVQLAAAVLEWAGEVTKPVDMSKPLPWRANSQTIRALLSAGVVPAVGLVEHIRRLPDTSTLSHQAEEEWGGIHSTLTAGARQQTMAAGLDESAPMRRRHRHRS